MRVNVKKIVYIGVILCVSIGCVWSLKVFASGGAAKPLAESSPELTSRYSETVAGKSDKKARFDMVLIPGGTFKMGSPDGVTGRRADEGPVHAVQLDPFYLCTTEVTLELFTLYYEETVSAKNKQRVGESGVDGMTGPTPIFGDISYGYSKDFPATGMSWLNATTFCKWLSLKTGKKYRLPTEAEWEYACRAGEPEAQGPMAPSVLSEYAWFEDNSDFEMKAVSQKKPNAWGLYDMLGNVNEWVSDFYSPDTYASRASEAPVLNPKGPNDGQVHVARGGSYEDLAENLRCSIRLFREESWHMGDPQIPNSIWWLPFFDIIGLRVACSVE